MRNGFARYEAAMPNVSPPLSSSVTPRSIDAPLLQHQPAFEAFRGAKCRPQLTGRELDDADPEEVELFSSCTEELQQYMYKSLACIDAMACKLEEFSATREANLEGRTSLESAVGIAGASHLAQLTAQNVAAAGSRKNTAHNVRPEFRASSTRSTNLESIEVSVGLPLSEDNGEQQAAITESAISESGSKDGKLANGEAGVVKTRRGRRKSGSSDSEGKDRPRAELKDSIKKMLNMLEIKEPPIPLYQQRTWNGQISWVLKYLEEPPRTGRSSRLADSSWWQLVVALVICFNAIITTWSADTQVRTLSEEPPSIAKNLETIFLFFYFCELCLNFYIHRFWFFFNNDKTWNMFDLFLVLAGLYELMFQIFASKGGTANLTFMRTLRLMKIVKVFRLFRVLRFFHSLRMMLLALVGSALTLTWVLLVLLFTLYVFALILIQGVTAYMLEANVYGYDTNGPLQQALYENFGSLGDAMLSLFKATTGGQDWTHFFNQLSEVSGFHAAVFIFYIAFFTFAVVNVLTGIFVEHAMSLGSPERDDLILQQRRKEEDEAKELKRACKLMDANGDGTIAWDEFETYSQGAEESDYLAAIGLDVHDAKMFFDMVTDITGQDVVEIDSFVEGALKMKGSATSIDLQAVHVETKLIHKMQKDFQKTTIDRLNRMDANLASIAKLSASAMPVRLRQRA